MKKSYKARVPTSSLGLNLPSIPTMEVDLFIGTEGQLWCWTKRGQVTVASSSEAYQFFDKYAICDEDKKNEGLRTLAGRRALQRTFA